MSKVWNYLHSQGWRNKKRKWCYLRRWESGLWRSRWPRPTFLDGHSSCKRGSKVKRTRGRNTPASFSSCSLTSYQSFPLVERSQEPKEKEVPTKLFTSISLLGYKTGQNRVKNGWGKDHTENNEEMDKWSGGLNWEEKPTLNRRERAFLLLWGQRSARKGLENALMVSSRVIHHSLTLQLLPNASLASMCQSLEGFLLDVKIHSFIHQRFTMCHTLFQILEMQQWKRCNCCPFAHHYILREIDMGINYFNMLDVKVWMLIYGIKGSMSNLSSLREFVKVVLRS